MTPVDLKRELDRAAKAIETFLSEPHAPLSGADEVELRAIAQRLGNGLYALLPPRGPTATLDCPHCGNPIKVALSK